MKLKDSQIQSFLEEYGFCKYDLQCKSILPQLEQLYKDVYTEEGKQNFFVTHNTGEGEKTKRVHQEIINICEPFISKHWKDYEVFVAHFVVKKGHSEASFQLHQDWNNLEERNTRSIQIWIPLQFSYPENGGMGFLPESHLFFDNYRSGSFDIPRVEVEPKLYPYLSYLRLFPGEAAFFYTSTFHCSFMNSTPNDRVAVLLNIIPKGTQNIYCHKNEETVEKYAITTEELYDRLHVLEKGQVPEGLELIEKEGYLQIDNVAINADVLISKLTERRARRNMRADYEVKQYSIIKDSELEKEINHFGYQVIDFLTEREVDMLLQLFPKYFPDRASYQGRYSSMDHLPKEKTLEVHRDIQEIIKQRLEVFFRDSYSPISLLYSKRPDGVSDIDWHSDPSFILNESLEPIYGIWCTLKDIGPKEGTLKVVPGSHRFIKRLNGAYVTWESPLKDHWRMIDQYGIQPNLKAGQAIIFDARMLHSSSPNVSEINRDCIVMRVCGNKTQDFFNILMEDGQKDKGLLYKQTSDYFFGDIVKSHVGKTNMESEGNVYFFPYEVNAQQIQEYFDRFNI